MRKMFSENQIKTMAKAVADSEISEKTMDAVVDGFDNADAVETIFGLNEDDQPAKQTADDLVKGVVESASSGTISSPLGLDSSGHLVKGTISGGTKLYRHYLSFGQYGALTVASSYSEAITSGSDLYKVLGYDGVNIGLPITNIIFKLEYAGAPSSGDLRLFTISYTNSEITWTQKLLLKSQFVSDGCTPL